MSAEHRKPVLAFVLLAFAAATLIGIQSADARGGRLMAAVIGGTVRVHGSLPLVSSEPFEASEEVADLGPVFEALRSDRAGARQPKDADPALDTGHSAAAVEVQRAVTTSVTSGTVAAGVATRGNTDTSVADTARGAAEVPADVQRVADRAEKDAARARARAERAAAKAERAADKAAERTEKAATRARKAAERALELASSTAEKTLRDLGRTIGSFSRDGSHGRDTWHGSSDEGRSDRDRDDRDRSRSDDRDGRRAARQEDRDREKTTARSSAYLWGGRDDDRSDRDGRGWSDRDGRSWDRDGRDRDRHDGGDRSWGSDGHDRDGSRHGWGH